MCGLGTATRDVPQCVLRHTILCLLAIVPTVAAVRIRPLSAVGLVIAALGVVAVCSADDAGRSSARCRWRNSPAGSWCSTSTTSKPSTTGSGDAVLRDTARVIRAHRGAEDVIARVGGEEFAVLLAAPGLSAATAAAEALRSAVARAGAVTVSIGAVFERGATTAGRGARVARHTHPSLARTPEGGSPYPQPMARTHKPRPRATGAHTMTAADTCEVRSARLHLRGAPIFHPGGAGRVLPAGTVVLAVGSRWAGLPESRRRHDRRYRPCRPTSAVTVGLAAAAAAPTPAASR
ncbi:diguanylate cyclase domain-containing protein [Tsukamurella soli]|uniref:diguanylate cyclase domain-containing protein n=1 Tax=Tsukamurella soli TaxID=644556 RepID=UPI003620B7A8